VTAFQAGNFRLYFFGKYRNFGGHPPIIQYLRQPFVPLRTRAKLVDTFGYGTLYGHRNLGLLTLALAFIMQGTQTGHPFSGSCWGGGHEYSDAIAWICPCM